MHAAALLALLAVPCAAFAPSASRRGGFATRRNSNEVDELDVAAFFSGPQWAEFAPSDAAAAAGDSGGAAAAQFALLFDCDGVIVETEELHRRAYNGAFEQFGLTMAGGEPVEWSVAYYDVLQNTVGGGKPKMKWHFETTAKAWPATVRGEPGPASYDDGGAALIDALQDAKTVIYRSIVEQAAVARPGVLELMDEAIAAPGIAVGICSAATRGGFEKITDAVVGPERLGALDVVIAGDDVERKKPDPQIYDLARARLGGLDASKCVVIEDSLVGLRAAKGARMACAITHTESTRGEDFFGEGADAVLADLGGVGLADLFGARTGADAGALFAGLSDAQRKPAA